MSKIEEILNILQLEIGSPARVEIERELDKHLKLALERTVGATDRLTVERELHSRLKKQLLAPDGDLVDPRYEANLVARAKEAVKARSSATKRLHLKDSVATRVEPGKQQLGDNRFPSTHAVRPVRPYVMELRANMTNRTAATSAYERKIKYGKVGDIWINDSQFRILDDSETERFLLSPNLNCTEISLLGTDYQLRAVENGKYTEIVNLKLGDVGDVLATYNSKASSAHAR